MEPRTSAKETMVFSSKAAVSALAALWCAMAFHLPGLIWAPVSAVIVTQPKLHPSYQASLTRVGANLIGACIGAAVGCFALPPVWAMVVAVFFTGVACNLARLTNATRPAFAAAVIVTFNNEPRVWMGSLDRVLCVVIGCVAALAVGWAFDGVSRLFPAAAGGEAPERKAPE